ncbi:MAG: NADH-ubiquinone oxidoreductase subunit NDUFA12 family protein [Candidatus Pacebacteria bacterium]|nr:NADH-ubiquinone oxidoreductase subunit NDUFA12 family protein [Candidatus Paceibacterota bacterium]
MADLGTVLATVLVGKKVGTDEFGNRYYCQRFARKETRLGHGTGRGSGQRRWVLYRGMVEASKVPAEWHGWLHYSGLAPVGNSQPKRRFWQKSFLPNLTGTLYARKPSARSSATASDRTPARDYEPWNPNS